MAHQRDIKITGGGTMHYEIPLENLFTRLKESRSLQEFEIKEERYIKREIIESINTSNHRLTHASCDHQNCH